MRSVMDYAHRHMRRVFRKQGPAGIAHLTMPQGSRLLLGSPGRGQPVTVTYADGTTVRGWADSVTQQRCRRGDGIANASMIDISLIAPDDPRLADHPFREVARLMRWPEVGHERTAEFDAVRRHLVSTHAMCNGLDLSDLDALDAHRHEHDGPGTIRGHDRNHLGYSWSRVKAILAEAAEMDGAAATCNCGGTRHLIGADGCILNEV